jgi:hypothetical protein
VKKLNGAKENTINAHLGSIDRSVKAITEINSCDDVVKAALRDIRQSTEAIYLLMQALLRID